MTEALPGGGPSGGNRRRTVLLVLGGVLILAVGGGGAWWLTRQPAPEAGPQLRTGDRPALTSPTVSALSPIATPAPTAGLNARNPFLGDLTTTTTTTTTPTGDPAGPDATTTTGTAPVTSSGTTTAATTSPGAGPVYVTVLSVDAKRPKYTAVFLVNGVRFTQDVGTTFGVPVTFSYDSTTVVNGERCARFAYGDEQHTLCPGEQINVA